MLKLPKEVWTIEAIQKKKAYFRDQIAKAPIVLADKPHLIDKCITAFNNAIEVLDRREEIVRQGKQPDF